MESGVGMNSRMRLSNLYIKQPHTSMSQNQLPLFASTTRYYSIRVTEATRNTAGYRIVYN